MIRRPLSWTRRAFLGSSLSIGGSIVLGCANPLNLTQPQSATGGTQGIEPLEPSFLYCSDDNHFFASLAHLHGLNRFESKDGTEYPNGLEGLPAGAVLLGINNQSAYERRVRVSIAMPPYGERANQVIDIPGDSGRYASLTPHYDFERLYALTTTTPAQVELEVTPEGGATQLLTETMLIEPVNRIAWQVQFNDSQLDMRKFVVALVTPADRQGLIHKLIKDASGFLKPPVMDGYQSGNKQNVRNQLNALYLALQKRGYNYTSISEGFFEGIQRVRPACVSLEHNTGNCIEGTLVFAAALEALGMEPSIVFAPGHAFLALAVEKGSKSNFFLETTMVGTGSFEDASASGGKQFARGQREGHLHFVDVQPMRQWRVPPVGL